MNDSVTMHTGPLGSTIHLPHADASDDAQSALTAEAASDADTEEPAPPSEPETSPGGAVRRARPLRGAPRTGGEPGFADVASGPLVRSFYRADRQAADIA